MRRDVYRFIKELAAETVDRIATRLEFRATDPGYVAFRDAYFARLPLASAPRILALSCGTGVEVRPAATSGVQRRDRQAGPQPSLH